MSVKTVLHINTADSSGGAARSVYRIHTGLKSLGLTSRLMVRYKERPDADIGVIAPAPFYALADKMLGLVWRLTALQYYFYLSSFRVLNHAWYKEADVVQLYNLHGNFFSPFSLPALSKMKPILWRLSDMWPLTGHCSYSYDCERWKTGCGECPILGEYPELNRDTTNLLWTWKKKAYEKSNLTLIAPSTWMRSLVEKSPLLGSFPIHVVPNGVTPGFREIDAAEAKQSWGLPPDRVVVLLQDPGPGGERKGRDLLAGIVTALREKHGDKISFLMFGVGAERWRREPGVVVAGLLEGEETLSHLYSAADVFVFPTKAENLANVALESMACGCPVVSFHAGGMADLIASGKNGMLTPNGNLPELIAATDALISDAAKRKQLARAAKETVAANFTQEKEARKILDIYNSVKRPA